MKSFDTRPYSINDFLEWSNNKQLELNPKFQRRSVWTDTARSYLMDTIIRGKPIPKIFIRQRLNVQTKQSIRDVVDGQQRLRTILSYLKDGFVISKKHNEKYGGLYFSQLSSVDDDIQEFLLTYEISTDLLVNMSDAEVLDIFSRLNSYSVILNDQERLNATHFGPFKTLADHIAHQYHDFWADNKILTDAQILRMGDVGLTADLVIAMTVGIKSKKQLKPYYAAFENAFDHNPEDLKKRFDTVIDTINGLFGSEFKTSEFRRIHIFYSLFTAVYHLKYGLLNFKFQRKDITENDYPRIANNLRRVNLLFNGDDIWTNTDSNDLQFLEDSRRATTDTAVRERRSIYLVDLMLK